MKYAVIIERGSSTFGASVPDLPGCVAVGRTRAEVVRLIEEAIDEHIRVLRSLHQPVPKPSTDIALIDVTP